MKLLLDEQHDPAVAQQLRRQGFDVVAVAERPELRSLTDDAILETAATERRALVTENVRDLVLVHRQRADAGASHYGILFTSHRRYPRTKAARRRLIAALGTFRRTNAREDGLRDQIAWL